MLSLLKALGDVILVPTLHRSIYLLGVIREAIALQAKALMSKIARGRKALLGSNSRAEILIFKLKRTNHSITASI